MEARPGKFGYMLIGGIVSTILTVISCGLLNYCCLCFGVGIGAYLGFRGWIRSGRWLDEPKASSSDAAILGMGAGAITAVLSNVVEWALAMLFGPSPAQQAMYMDDLSDLYRNAGIDPSFLEFLMAGQNSNVVTSLLVGSCFEMVLFGIFGAIWALIGANLFHRKLFA